MLGNRPDKFVSVGRRLGEGGHEFALLEVHLVGLDDDLAPDGVVNGVVRDAFSRPLGKEPDQLVLFLLESNREVVEKDLAGVALVEHQHGGVGRCTGGRLFGGVPRLTDAGPIA